MGEEVRYDSLAAEQGAGWRDIDGRADIPLALAQVRRGGNGATVLDVGCFCGDFIGQLGGDFRRLGIEPSAIAASLAERAGVQIVGHTIADTSLAPASLDHIVMLNVFEHLSAPLDSLAKLAEWLCPGGGLTIGTGATDSLPWRLLGNEHWYCRIEGHCVFLNRAWVEWAAPRLGLVLDSWRVIPHRRASRRGALREWMHLLLYAIPRQRGAVCRACRHIFPFSRSKSWLHAPITTHLPDHVLLTLRRPV